MAYSHNYRTSALRHLKAAETLHALSGSGTQPGSQAVAGYLYGLAGELAVKQMMTESGMRPLVEGQRRTDPFYKHFPEIKSSLLSSASGRRAGQLLSVARSDQVFREWSTDMRYAPTSEVPAARVNDWQQHARTLVAKMEEQ